VGEGDLYVLGGLRESYEQYKSQTGLIVIRLKTYKIISENPFLSLFYFSQLQDSQRKPLHD